MERWTVTRPTAQATRPCQRDETARPWLFPEPELDSPDATEFQGSEDQAQAAAGTAGDLHAELAAYGTRARAGGEGEAAY